MDRIIFVIYGLSILTGILTPILCLFLYRTCARLRQVLLLLRCMIELKFIHFTSFHSLIWLWMNWTKFQWLNTTFEWWTSASLFPIQYFFRGVQLDQDSDVDDGFTLGHRLWIMILRKLLNIVSRFKIWWHHHHNETVFNYIILVISFYISSMHISFRLPW